jgi:hypothetical protein
MQHPAFDILFVLALIVPAAAVIVGGLLVMVPRQRQRTRSVRNAVHV